jgi:hypothetical protein
MKVCQVCERELPLSEFVKHKRRDWYATHCKSCKYVLHKRYRQENLQRVRDIERKHKLKKAYGISVEEYNSMLNKQNGRCAICRNSPDNKRLCVDHCHVTGRVRGLLCQKCNRGLGLFKDNTDSLFSAIKYLKGI